MPFSSNSCSVCLSVKRLYTKGSADQGCGSGLIQSGSGSSHSAQSGSGSTKSVNPDPDPQL
jgi:hypothetical protein